MDWIQLVGSEGTIEVPGVKLVGVNAENGAKLLVTAVPIVVVVPLGKLLRASTSATSASSSWGAPGYLALHRHRAARRGGLDLA